MCNCLYSDKETGYTFGTVFCPSIYIKATIKKQLIFKIMMNELVVSKKLFSLQKTYLRNANILLDVDDYNSPHIPFSLLSVNNHVFLRNIVERFTIAFIVAWNSESSIC